MIALRSIHLWSLLVAFILALAVPGSMAGKCWTGNEGKNLDVGNKNTPNIVLIKSGNANFPMSMLSKSHHLKLPKSLNFYRNFIIKYIKTTDLSWTGFGACARISEGGIDGRYVDIAFDTNSLAGVNHDYEIWGVQKEFS